MISRGGELGSSGILGRVPSGEGGGRSVEGEGEISLKGGG